MEISNKNTLSNIFIVDSDQEFEQILKEHERQLNEAEREKEERRLARIKKSSSAKKAKKQKKEEGGDEAAIQVF